MKDSLEPDRLVFGVGSPEAEAILRSVYAAMIAGRPTPVVVTDLPTSELVKVAANSFLATKISFINAMAELCEATGADVMQLVRGARVRRPHRREVPARRARVRWWLPAQGHPGVHGPRRRARGRPGADVPARGRRDQPAPPGPYRRPGPRVARRVVRGAAVAVLGAAFKPDSDDVRDSPGAGRRRSIHEQGGRVRVYDPQAMENARARFPLLTTPTTSTRPAPAPTLVLHLTEWPEFRELDPAARGRGRSGRSVDGRNVLDPDRWRAAGWTYRALGRP